jgi:hypothetical protein
MKKNYFAIGYPLILVLAFAGCTGNRFAFNEFPIPYSSASWTSTKTTSVALFSMKFIVKSEKQYWYKNEKMKIVRKTLGPKHGKQEAEVDLLARGSFIEYKLPDRTGFSAPADVPNNSQYIAPGSSRAKTKAGLRKSGETEKIGGIECEVYQGSYDPQLRGMSKDFYYKEWRTRDGFVMKNEGYATDPKQTVHWIEEVHGLKTNIDLPDSIFTVPPDVEIKPFDRKKPMAFVESPQMTPVLPYTIVKSVSDPTVHSQLKTYLFAGNPGPNVSILSPVVFDSKWAPASSSRSIMAYDKKRDLFICLAEIYPRWNNKHDREQASKKNSKKLGRV